MMQGVLEREERLRALKKVQLDADITRLRGNLAAVPVAHVTTMENAIAQLERDLKQLARKQYFQINETQTDVPGICKRHVGQHATRSGHAALRALYTAMPGRSRSCVP